MAERFGPYRLEELLGQGGMGEVYRAYDTVKGRAVAIKRLPSYMANDADFKARFRRESRLVAQLRHPHIIPIHDFGEIDGQLFIDMRLIDGDDLSVLLARDGALSPARAVDIVLQMADAIDAAHAEGLVHRDIKPSNTLISRPDRELDYVYLVDFGIARTASSTGLTRSGEAVGTLDYMAPERFLTGHGDYRVDIYALTCLLYESLTARKPFPFEGLPAQMYAHVHKSPPAPTGHHPGIPAAFDEVVAIGMAKDPTHRYRSAGDLAAAARSALTYPSSAATVVPRSISKRVLRPPTLREAAQETLVPSSKSASSALRPARRRGIWALAIAISLVATIGVILLVNRSPNSPKPPIKTTPGSAPPTTIFLSEKVENLVLSPDGRYAYVTSSDLVSVVDTERGSVAATIPITESHASEPTVAISPDGHHLYVADEGSGDGPGTVSVIDTRTNTLAQTIPVGVRPSDVAVSSDGQRAYVTNFASGGISIIDTQKNSVIGAIPILGDSLTHLAVSPNGQQLYVLENFFTHGVAVVDAASGVVSANIPSSGPTALAVSPDGRHVYVANGADGTLSVIETATNTIAATIPVGKTPVTVTVSRDGRVYVANFDSGTVSVLDPATNAIIKTIVTSNPGAVAISPDGQRLYVTHFGSSAVAAIDT